MSIALHYSFRKLDQQLPCDSEHIQEDQVEQVYLKCCDLTEFPEWIASLSNLTHINASCNAIEQLPPTIGSLSHLNYLDLANNRLTELPKSLFDLTGLQYLDFSEASIKVIPTELKNLINLEYLNLGGNLIEEVPDEITSCERLLHVSFEGCSRLVTIPNKLLAMPNLESISLKNCNLTSLPSLISPSLGSFLFTGNRLLSWIPYEALKFIDPNMTTSEFFILSEREVLNDVIFKRDNIIRNYIRDGKLFETTSGKVLRFPRQIERVFTISSTETISLVELSLKALVSEQFHLPRHLSKILGNHVAICACQSRVFTQAFTLIFYEKQRPHLEVMTTKFFCSKKCLMNFYESHKEKLIFES